MAAARRVAGAALLAALLAGAACPPAAGLPQDPAPPARAVQAGARAPGCAELGSRQAGLAGRVPGTNRPACPPQAATPLAAGGQPVTTVEIACWPPGPGVAVPQGGFCTPEVTPCIGDGGWYAFRTVHRPGAPPAPAGWACVQPERAPTAVPGVSAAGVFGIARQASLPAGQPAFTPRAARLAGVRPARWLAAPAPVVADVRAAGGMLVVRVEALPVRYRSYPNPAAVLAGPGASVPPTVVETTWRAQVYLNGQPVGRVEGLVSATASWFPAEGALPAGSPGTGGS